MRSLFSLPFWRACLGNLFEHYDAALFGFLSPFLAPLLFPEQDHLTALILTYLMIPLGMLARPLGSLVFGYIGDCYGRQQALFFSMGGMALVSGLMALTPTYQLAGPLASLFFCLGRLAQNFLAAGETMGGAIFLLEHAPEKDRNFLSSLYSASTIGGILLASAGVWLFSYYQAIELGWRILYGIGSLTALFGCLIRRGLKKESATFISTQVRYSIPALMVNFWTFRRPLLLIALCAGFSYATYSIALILMNSFVPFVSSFSKADMMSLNTALLVVDFCALPLFGWLTCKIAREKLMLASAILTALGAIPLILLLKQGSFLTILSVRISFVLLGVAFFAPFHAWAQDLVPPSLRYSLISFGYACGTQLLGGPTAAISLWLFQKTALLTSVMWYWSSLALLCSLALTVHYAAARRKSQQISSQIQNLSNQLYM